MDSVSLRSRRRPASRLAGIAAAAALVTGAVVAPGAAGPVEADARAQAGLQGQSGARSMVLFGERPGWFPLSVDGDSTPVVVSGQDFDGVVRVAGDLALDVERVTGTKPRVLDEVPASGPVVLVGTLGQSPLIDALVADGRLDVRAIEGTWETSLQVTVPRPFPGVRQALVIVGSDQRGTIYGAYEVSRQIGVSPWHFFDDVPTAQHDDISIRPGRHTQGTPAVRYRGFFINDEAPNLSSWVAEHYGPAPGHPQGFGHDFYADVFEAALRLKANYLWPAVWGRAFAEDDPENHATAKRYGVVMGTSHEAPMMRGIEEWNRAPEAYGGTGEWSFVRNREAVEAYWRDGVRRMRDEDFEGVVTLGMRGNGDTALPDGTGSELMEEIMASQREILAEELGPGTDVSQLPQVFTLYKEVQRYWEQGLQPPDDVTVVFADDNWGNMRKLPDPSLPERSGGYGLYYHFDYVGAARNYKWVDTTNIVNTWEQLHTSYEYGIDRLWMANVGDMKNEELALQFFLDYAWDPSAWPAERLPAWLEQYAAQSFGTEHAAEIADILHEYGVLQARRKPELLNLRMDRSPYQDPTAMPPSIVQSATSPFNPTSYRELETVTDEWQHLAARAEAVRAKLRPGLDDAYFQLVHYQVAATANAYELREAQWLNLQYAEQGRAGANALADQAEEHFAQDVALSDYYNNDLADGKWHNFQRQPKFGYTTWQDPPLPDRIYPELRRTEVPRPAEMGVTIDGAGGFGAVVEPEVVHQAEDARMEGVQVASNWSGYTGTGFANPLNASGDWVEWTVDALEAGAYTLLFRYANGGTGDRPMDVSVGGEIVRRAPFPATGAWGQWKHAAVQVDLPAGESTVRITSTGARGVNVDYLGVSAGAVDPDPSENPWWPHSPGAAVLPAFSPYQTASEQYIEVFNRGSEPFRYTITPSVDWLTVKGRTGTVDDQARVELAVDWRRAPSGTTQVPIEVVGSEGTTVTVQAVVENPDLARVAGHVEAQGVVSIEAGHHSRAVSSRSAGWKTIDDIGRTGDGVIPWPVTAPTQVPGPGTAPRLEYRTTFTSAGPVDISAYVSPRNAALASDGLRYAISVDDGEPQVVDITVGSDDERLNSVWGRSATDAASTTTTRHTIDEPGVHTIKVWMVDPTVVFQKFVVDTGGERWSYLGPPESARR
ncbi:glycosyl hydrolase 115 family protein [Promicromonospora panici]|uniref:glycosyl hydrolase 115 family protein n=1 Tax=Promicromonospora panici TaxID=2219658 RepID=UPI00101D2BB7|nr:glycosyl hydrolase 115 family protein [Promicromonospora panici]